MNAAAILTTAAGSDILGIAGLNPQGVGIWSIFATLILGFWRNDIVKRRLASSDSAALIAAMLIRISDLEKSLAAQIIACAAESLQLRKELMETRKAANMAVSV